LKHLIYSHKFVITQLALVCFELNAINVVVAYWAPNLNPAILIACGLVLLGALNLYSVRWFGEVEFWISITKVFLMIGLTLYTVVTMAGGNPLRDAYGFRYWQSPGAFAKSGFKDRITGIFDSVVWSTFT
jgi:amino acid transporter